MDRDPPHYLQPLKTTTTPKRLLWLYCAGYVTRRSERNELHFQAAVLGKTWWTARKGEQRDTRQEFTDPDELWNAIGDWCPQGRRTVLFTWDLAEQIRLSHGLTILPRAGWEIDKIVLERTASWCLLRNGKRTLMCCDLQSWVPTSFGKLRATVIAGGPLPNDVMAGKQFASTRCHDRVSTVRLAALQILNWIEGENLGPFRPTGSGQSIAGYRRRFGKTRLLVHDNVSRLSAERRAMHTGRAEAWRHGRLTAGPYVEFDLHAAYATIGRDCAVPVRARGEQRKPSMVQLQSLMRRYAVLADVTVTTEIPCIPYRVNNRTLWPVGTFRTQIWEPELELAWGYANSVRVNHAWTYVREPALREFCGWVLDGMGGQTQVYGLVPQRVLKHWSRCLVGRFGLRYREWIKFGPLDPPDVRLVTYLDVDEGFTTDMLYAGTQRLLLGELTEARESLPQIPGWIMAECRARLFQMMLDAGLDNVVYVDTDSIIVSQSATAGVDRHHREFVGETWVQKGSYSRLTIHGPRNLEVGYSRRVAGLPLSATQTRPLEFTGEVMRGVKHAMRNGELDTVVSLPRTFHLQAVDLRRQHNPDGSTYPYRVEESCS